MELERFVTLETAVKDELHRWMTANWMNMEDEEAAQNNSERKPRPPLVDTQLVTVAKQMVTNLLVEWVKTHSTGLQFTVNFAEMSVNMWSDDGFKLTVKAVFVQFHKTFLRFEYFADEYKKLGKPDYGRLKRCVAPEDWVREVLGTGGFPTLQENLSKHFLL